MNTYESLESLYKTLEPTFGREGAKKTVSKVIDLVMEEFQENGIAPTQENLAKRFSKYQADFDEVSRHHTA